MKPDDFENQLQRQPLRAAPAEWRAEILQAAQAATPHASRPAAHASPWWREWLWPSPQAWAGLAALWIAIAVLNATTESRSSDLAKQTPNPSLEIEAEATLAAQRRELARLLDNFTESVPTPKAGPPGPRSENVSPPKV